MTSDALVLAIVLLATLIRSTLGFGEALVAVPLLALLVPVQVAAPLAVLVSITVALAHLIHDWREVEVKSASWLVAATLAGIPLGLWLLTHLDPLVVKAVLGLVIAAFGTFSLARRDGSAVLEEDRLSWLLGCGLCAGVLGGAYGMNGPPLVVYGSLRRWSPGKFRSTLQAYFLPASLVGMTGYWLAGLWVPEVTRLYLLSLPAVLAAIVAGRAINRRVPGNTFRRVVLGALVIVGLVLLAQSLAGTRAHGA